MLDKINIILDSIILLIQSSGLLGVFLSCGLILIESIFPILPLMVFINLNYLALGPIIGIIISWIFTIAGCCLSYYIFRNGLGEKFELFTENKKQIKKYVKLFKNISVSKLILIVAFPFTPAFTVNIAAGLAKMDFKKYFIALLFGKVSLILYSVYVGTSLLESFKNPIKFLEILSVILITYIIFKVVKKVFKLNI